jgi:diguanylate cyclase (GGDEF)-like protein
VPETKGRVLLVDDSKTIRAVVGGILREHGYEPSFAACGGEAFEALRGELPDVIILDLHLPDVDGFEVCRRIKNDPRTYHIPVLVLTTLDQIDTEVMAIDAGADDFITKPPDARVLDARVRMHIKRARRERFSSPLTGLPGNVLIEQELSDRFARGGPLTLVYVDLDNFKNYNDRYGYQRGDAVILLTASIIQAAVRTLGEGLDFVGHIGGDDFVILTAPSRAEAIANRVIAAFDEAIVGYYDTQTRERGWFEAVDRRGEPFQVPIMTISLASVSTENRAFDTTLQMIDVVTELKHHAKHIEASVFVRDRRGVADAVSSPETEPGDDEQLAAPTGAREDA